MFRRSGRPRKKDVIQAYRTLLDRYPENLDVIQHHRHARSLPELWANIKSSEEFRSKEKNHAFFYYNSTFDAVETIRRHAVVDLKAEPGHITNFLGIRISPSVCPAMLQGHAGEVESLPIPGNWHADIAEFAAVLRSVELAQESFTMAELGCGWGCWMNNAGAVARRRHLKLRLIGVEGDEGHIAMAKETLAFNGFCPEELRLYWGIAAATSGHALFPRQSLAGTNWGLEPIFNPDTLIRKSYLQSGSHYELPLVSLSRIIDENTGMLDLLHIDIQGGEAKFVHNSLDVLKKHVRYIVIGTHSREIEGLLFGDLLTAGWRLEIERPAILNLDHVPQVAIDGVQGWRNYSLEP